MIEIKGLTEVPSIAELRRFVGLTQRQVAERLGVVQSRVSDIERKWPNVRLSTAQDYVRALGGRLRVDMVFDAEGAAKKTTTPQERGRQAGSAPPAGSATTVAGPPPNRNQYPEHQ